MLKKKKRKEVIVCNTMSFCPNHMIQKLLESQDHVVYWTKVLKPFIMSSFYAEVISQKHANTRAVF
jgi:hypothetical protein